MDFICLLAPAKKNTTTKNKWWTTAEDLETTKPRVHTEHGLGGKCNFVHCEHSTHGLSNLLLSLGRPRVGNRTRKVLIITLVLFLVCHTGWKFCLVFLALGLLWLCFCCARFLAICLLFVLLLLDSFSHIFEGALSALIGSANFLPDVKSRLPFGGNLLASLTHSFHWLWSEGHVESVHTSFWTSSWGGDFEKVKRV